MDIKASKIGSIKLDLEVFGKPRILIFDKQDRLLKIFKPKAGHEHELFNSIVIAWYKEKGKEVL